jgi:thiol:disulfide interchange protein
MRFLLTRLSCFVVFLLSTSLIFAQSASIINWKSKIIKQEANSLQVEITGEIKQGWWLYAKHDDSLGITGLTAVVKPGSGLDASEPDIATATVAKSDVSFENAQVQVVEKNVVANFAVSSQGKLPASIDILLNYNVGANSEFVPEEDTIKLLLDAQAAAQVEQAGANSILLKNVNLEKPLADCKTSGSVAGSAEVASSGLWKIFGLGFLGGLVGLLMPCLFPMVPLTVSFFTKKNQSKQKGIVNAFLYGFFIFLIYVLITVPFHLVSTLSPEIFNNISTNVYLNVIFFIIFVVFALSFFGLFDINLPSSLTNTTDSKSGAKSITGIFFMALTLTIVSFSCTGPIAGSLLAGAVGGPGGAMRLTFGMAGFGLAIGLPFGLFALFPNLLQALPKSGGWLTSVKIVLGFLELAFAFKFLSNADLVQHWGLLKREIFIGIWVIISALLALYLWGILKFKHDPVPNKLSIGRKLLATVFTVFALYLSLGVTNTKYANLKLISGFPPPLYYSIYAKDNAGMLNLTTTKSYEEGIALAKQQNKLLLIDFTGFACVNCRKMEENVWTRPEVYALLQEKFVIASLYVDDKANLPADKQFTYKTKEGVERQIQTVGDKWSVFETENFKQNSQPLYVVLNTKEQMVNYPSGYADGKTEFLNWLQCAVIVGP